MFYEMEIWVIMLVQYRRFVFMKPVIYTMIHVPVSI